MKNNCGVVIESVSEDSPAAKAGIMVGDALISINGHNITDVIDMIFHGSDPHGKLLVRRGNKTLSIEVNANIEDGISSGIALKHMKVKTCRNNCIFCFVSQLPKGLRKTLYVKDEDYRLSFLYGNYMTLTNLTDEDKKRIVKQRLSPIYVSVHSTDIEVRNAMLGNAKAPDVMKELKYFASKRIRMHTQIVLCPGYNDGKNLTKTISDLYKFYPYIMSVAVVPVGLTSHRKKALMPVDKESASSALGIIHKFQQRFRKKHGDSFVYGADELYIKAEAEFPKVETYGEFPQIENGVGMVVLFMHDARKVKIPAALKDFKSRFVTFTGVSFYPYLSKFIDRLVKAGIDIEAVPVENAFFGKSVTVTGLLTGRDVMKSLSGMTKKNDILLIPDVVMREGDNIFLDDVSLKDIEDILEVKAIVIESTPKGIIGAIVKETS
jgi:putative radical SAM enzyme (TIGR03279 family)